MTENPIDIYKQLIESTDKVYFLINVEKTKIEFVSHYYKKLFLMKREELYEDITSFLQFVDKRDRYRVEKSMTEFLLAPMILTGRFRLSIGQARSWVELTTFPLLSDKMSKNYFAGVMEPIKRPLILNKKVKQISRIRSMAINTLIKDFLFPVDRILTRIDYLDNNLDNENPDIRENILIIKEIAHNLKSILYYWDEILFISNKGNINGDNNPFK